MRPTPARDRILKAANALFYRCGFAAVSLDAIAERAGVTKRTIYYHFDSKDDLVAEYVRSRDQPNMDFYRTCFDRAEGNLSDRIEAIFLEIGRQAQGRRWRGCGFLRAAAELVDTPGHPALKAGAAHKKRLESWLADRFSEDLEADAAAELAAQIALLLDGEFSALLIHRDRAYGAVAGRAAVALVDAHLAGSAPRCP